MKKTGLASFVGQTNQEKNVKNSYQFLDHGLDCFFGFHTFVFVANQFDLVRFLIFGIAGGRGHVDVDIVIFT